MGDRTYVFLESSSFPDAIAIYAHWGNTEIYEIVKDVVASSDRVGDPSYLSAAIIHACFKAFEYDGRLGFGVAPVSDPYATAEWADNPSMYVDLDNGDYRIGEATYDRFGNDKLLN
jgi:hypothetical protein